MPAVFDVQNIHCDACARRVTNAVKSVAPASVVQVDVKSGRVAVEPPGDSARVGDAITAAGYPAKLRP